MASQSRTPSSGPFTPRPPMASLPRDPLPSSRLTCPSVPVPWLQSVKGSPGPRQLPFGPGTILYPASWARRPLEGAVCRLAFLPPFGPPALASWTIVRPPGSWAFLAVGLPDLHPDPDGVVTFHTV